MSLVFCDILLRTLSGDNVPVLGSTSAHFTFSPNVFNGWVDARQLIGEEITSSPGFSPRTVSAIWMDIA